MSRQIQLRRGTADEHATFTGAIGEVTVDTTNKTLRVHDGQTPGGIPLARADAETDLNGADYVTEWQTPTAENNYTWYRKYKSGWVEQGGIKNNESNNTASFITVNLSIPMLNTQYSIFTTCCSDYTNGTSSSHAYVMEKAAVVNSITNTSFQIYMQNSSSNTVVYWSVSGCAM